MGLNFKDSNASWSYSGFNNFRRRLAREIGIDLDDMCGFSGEKSWSEVNDDIVPLLNHSDCEGRLTSAECRKVAPRLRKLVANWPDDYDKRTALELANDMVRLAKKGRPLTFM